MSLQLQGRDEEDVLTFSGSLEGLTLWPWALTAALGGLLAASLLLGGILGAAQGHPWRLIGGVGITGLVALGVVGGSLWWIRLCREIPGLSSLRDVGAQLGVDEELLRRWTVDHAIRPRVKVNGERLYRSTDFGDCALLLRASRTPTPNSDILLRTLWQPAADPDLLPRPAERR